MNISLSARVHALVLAVGSVAAALLFVVFGPVAGAWASNSCPNEVFRTGAGASLPDCRAYELVSPANKNGGQVDGGLSISGQVAPAQAAADGEAVTYGSQTTFTAANPASSITASQYLSRRGPAGWSTQAITPRQNPGPVINNSEGSVEDSLFEGFSEDLSSSFLVANEPAPVADAPAGYFNPYLRDDEDGGVTLLSTVTPPVREPGLRADGETGLLVEYGGMSADGGHVIFAANDGLTERAVPGRTNLYEWSASGLELVSVLPEGEPYAGGSERTLSPGLAFGGPSEEGLGPNYSHAISADGKRVFWTAGGYEGGAEHQVYMREITGGGERTVEVSASQRTDCADHSPCGGTPEPDPNGPSPAHYWTASADGSLVYFTSCQKLTNDSTAEYLYGRCFQSGDDLYQYNVDTGVLRDLTVDHNPGGTASVVGVLGASEDGAYVYFAAGGVLASGAVAQPNGYNVYVYVWHEGVTSLIASLGNQGSEESDWDQSLPERTSRVTPDGRHLAFQSEEPLTGYDNLPVNREACQTSEAFRYGSPSKRCMEVYEYSVGTGSLVCASCNPSGLPPVGNSSVPREIHALAEDSHYGWQSTTVQQRYLSDDGSRLFFTSEDALVSQASDGKRNVYEYEQDGAGSCASASGCVYLISSGTSNENSYFIDASADGSDVFFLTAQQLVALDGDDALDVYDARVGGGFEAPSTPVCSGEACRAPVTPAPSIYGAPSSATFAGAGYPAPVVSAAGKSATGKKKPKPKKKTGKKKSRAKGKRRAVKAKRSSRRSERGGRR